MKNGEAQKLIDYLVSYIETSLNEIAVSKDGENADGAFLTGEAYAYAECLEIILLRMGASKEELLKIEKRYGIE
ncbi:MAG: hypothetical protein K2N30_02795 [Clostridia bacterium]|nr:hypothetical protein [Clostridia bacterium]